MKMTDDAETKFIILIEKKWGVKHLFLKFFCKNYDPYEPLQRIVSTEVLGYEYLTEISEFNSEEEALNYAKENSINYNKIEGILLIRSPMRQGKGR